MAGHRKKREPTQRWRERAARAVTPDEQLTVAYDRLRAKIASLRRRVQDALERESNTARADSLAVTAASALNEISDREEREAP